MKAAVEKVKRLFHFGVITDVQYCDIDDAWVYEGTQLRKYRGALTSLTNAVERFNREKVPLVLQLGDLIDGHNAAKSGPFKGEAPQSTQAVERMIKVFDTLHPTMSVYHSIGTFLLCVVP